MNIWPFSRFRKMQDQIDYLNSLLSGSFSRYEMAEAHAKDMAFKVREGFEYGYRAHRVIDADEWREDWKNCPVRYDLMDMGYIKGDEGYK